MQQKKQLTPGLPTCSACPGCSQQVTGRAGPAAKQVILGVPTKSTSTAAAAGRTSVLAPLLQRGDEDAAKTGGKNHGQGPPRQVTFSSSGNVKFLSAPGPSRGFIHGQRSLLCPLLLKGKVLCLQGNLLQGVCCVCPIKLYWPAD